MIVFRCVVLLHSGSDRLIRIGDCTRQQLGTPTHVDVVPVAQPFLTSKRFPTRVLHFFIDGKLNRAVCDPERTGEEARPKAFYTAGGIDMPYAFANPFVCFRVVPPTLQHARFHHPDWICTCARQQTGNDGRREELGGRKRGCMVALRVKNIFELAVEEEVQAPAQRIAQHVRP